MSFHYQAFAKIVSSAWNSTSSLINSYLLALWSFLPGSLPWHLTPCIRAPSLHFCGALSLYHQWISPRLIDILVYLSMTTQFSLRFSVPIVVSEKT